VAAPHTAERMMRNRHTHTMVGWRRWKNMMSPTTTSRLVAFLSTVSMATLRYLSAKNDDQIIPTKMRLTGAHSRQSCRVSFSSLMSFNTAQSCTNTTQLRVPMVA
jgi:hypothetical protein